MKLKYYLRGLGLGILVTALVLLTASGGRKESLSDAQIKARAKELGMTESTVLAEYAEKSETGKASDEHTEPEENKAQEEDKAAEDNKTPGTDKTSEEDKTPGTDKTSEEDKTPGTDKTLGEDKTSGTDKTSGEDKTSGTDKTSGEDKTPGTDKTSGEDKTSGTDKTSEEDKMSETDKIVPGKKPAEPAVFIINRGDGSYTVSEHLKNAGLISSAADFDRFLVENGYDKKIVAGEHMIPTDADEELIAGIITGQQ